MGLGLDSIAVGARRRRRRRTSQLSQFLNTYGKNRDLTSSTSFSMTAGGRKHINAAQELTQGVNRSIADLVRRRRKNPVDVVCDEVSSPSNLTNSTKFQG